MFETRKEIKILARGWRESLNFPPRRRERSSSKTELETVAATDSATALTQGTQASRVLFVRAVCPVDKSDLE